MKLFIALLLCSVSAIAAPDLAIICPDAKYAAKQVGTDWCPGQYYGTPKPEQLIRTRTSTSTAWEAKDFIWAYYGAIPVGGKFEVCRDDLADNSTVDAPNCKTWGFNLKTSATAGVMPLRWDAVTSDINGSPVSNIRYRVYHGASVDKLIEVIDVGGVTSYVITGLPAGTHSATATALNGTTESDKGNITSAAIAGVSPPIPKPPVVTLDVLPAYDYVKSSDKAAWKAVGTIPASTHYLPFSATDSVGVTRCGVPRAALKRATGITSTPQQVYAPC